MAQRIAKWLLGLGGWTAIGDHPAVDKAVFIAAPHTSNWDGYWALVYKVAVGIDVHFFAKHTLFWFPLGSILRVLGGIPLDRERRIQRCNRPSTCSMHAIGFILGLHPKVRAA